MRNLILLAAAAALLSPNALMAQSEALDITGQRERWYYTSNPCSGGDCTSRDRAGIWAIEDTSLPYHYRAAVSLVEVDVALPAGIDPLNYEVTEATLTVWAYPEQLWANTTQFELFALGYNPQGFTDPVANPFYTRESFNIVTSPFIGSSNFARAIRDPFCRNLADDSNADEQQSGATPWAIGTYAASEVDPANPNPIEIVFTLDVSDPKIQAQIKDDIALGQSRWFVASDSNVEAFGAGAPITNIYHSPNLNIPAGASAPVFQASVANTAASSVNAWVIFEF